jgi:hypothetical protein
MKTAKNWALRPLLAFGAALLFASSAEAAVSCHKINAKGVGQDLGGGRTQAQIIGGGLLHGTTAASFSIVGGTPPVLLISGTVTFTVQGGTLAVQVGGSFDVSNPSTGTSQVVNTLCSRGWPLAVELT